MRFIAERCTGCETCRLICSLYHDGTCDPSLARLEGERLGPSQKLAFLPHCDGCAVCADFCPYGAIEEED
ncbi:MAG: 4Fe-4S binding protein [Actinobacteria bacterium]|nr:4Fe-4S binding protein [Actinomycetota bacterium]